MTDVDVKRQLEVISRGVEEIITPEELEDKLKRKDRLTVKLGIDPTAKDIHLGFAVVLRKFRQFQDLGHRCVLILGDFTAMVGDPSGKSKTRPMLSKEQIEENVKTYLKQMSKIISVEKAEVVYNSEWLGKMSLEELIRLASKYTLAQMLEREDFKNRYKSQSPIGLHELLYPLFQAYDSVYLNADVELGGIDQRFNILVARYIQKQYGQEPEVAVLTPVLEGLDGVQKMSKSLGNYVGISEKPEVMFSKLMTVPDHLIPRYMLLATDIPLQDIEAFKEGMESGKLNPRDVKMIMAQEIVRLYWGDKAAERAKEEFIKVYSKGELPSEVESISVPKQLIADDGTVNLIDLLLHAGLADSRREAKRMIDSGALEIDGEKVQRGTRNLRVQKERLLIKYGKRTFKELVFSEN